MAGHGRIQLAAVEKATTYLTKMSEYINAGMDTALDITEDLTANGLGEGTGEIKEIDDVMLGYLKMDRELKQFCEAIAFVKCQALSLTSTECLDLEKMLDEKVAELASNNSDSDLTNETKYKNFIETVKMGSEGQSDSVSMVSGATADSELASSQDAEIAVTQQKVNTRCPFTGREMQWPVRNKRCGHNYDRDGIIEFMKSRGDRAKCPVSGCINKQPLKESDLESNKELKRHIDQKNRQDAKKRMNKKR